LLAFPNAHQFACNPPYVPSSAMPDSDNDSSLFLGLRPLTKPLLPGFRAKGFPFNSPGLLKLAKKQVPDMPAFCDRVMNAGMPLPLLSSLFFPVAPFPQVDLMNRLNIKHEHQTMKYLAELPSTTARVKEVQGS
jgi:hypothetical protein